MGEKTSGMFRATARFVDHEGEPLRGEAWSVTLDDRDPLCDDHLGETAPDNEGRVAFLIAVADVKSIDSPGERNPDLYFTVFRGGEAVYRSPVLEDVDFEKLDPVSGEPADITQDFGTFRVSAGSA